MKTETLTANQTHALAALLSHPTREAAAKAVGVSAKTISRWLREEPFAAAYREARRDLLGQATQTLAVACVSAVETLTGIMTNPNSPAYSRIRAAKLLKSGQRLAVWLCDRYKDHREGRPVSLHPAIAEAVIFDRDGHPKYECPNCRLRLPRLATTCPKCNIQVTKDRQYINYDVDSPAPQFG